MHWEGQVQSRNMQKKLFSPLTRKISATVVATIAIVSGATSVSAFTQIIPTNQTPCVGTDTFAGVRSDGFIPSTPQPILPNTNPPWVVWGGFSCSSSYNLQSAMTSAPSGNYWFLMGDNSGGNMVEPWVYGAFYWNGIGVSFPTTGSSSSYFFLPISPVSSPTASTTVPFVFSAWNTGSEGYDKIGVEITDFTSLSVLVPAEVNTSIGTSTFAVAIPLVQGHGYFWRPYLRNSASTTEPYLYGNQIGLIDVVSGSGLSAQTQYISGDIGTSTNAFFDYLNLPQLMSERIPFAYLPALVNQLSSFSTSSAQFPSLTFTVGSSTDLIHFRWEILSTSTIQKYSGTGNVNLLRDLIAYSLWLSFFAMVFFDVRTIHK